MVQEKLFLVLGCILHMHSALALWSCSVDSDCYSVVGSVCTNGACVCPPGKQNVLGGLACADVAPYHFSQCVENFQCSRLFTTFECRRSNGTDAEVGNCFCTPGNHYFRGRCWTNIDEGQACTHDQQCLGGLRDPFSMVCRGTCECADGYYLRQRGECRRIGAAVGAGCVLDEDCQFEGGACNPTTFQCFDANAETDQNAEGFVKPHAVPEEKSLGPAEPSNQRDLQGYGAPCNSNAQCMDAFECSSFGICTCPLGYYPNAPRTNCLAELGSPAEPNQCVGLFTEIRDGICTCQTNFYFNEDMRTCVKAARFITDACLVDENCHTFGAQSRCGEPQLWGLRSCECITEYAQWDANRNMCRLFARIGEECEEDSDCLAGEMEVSCVADAQGQGRCECPPGLTAVGELCLQLGLELGDACQVDLECTGTENTVCTNGLCSCTAGYQPDGDVCAPVIGGTCATTSDCVIENTVCAQDTLTCQCDQLFVEQEDICWPVAEAHNASCTIDAQCVAGVGAGAGCVNGACACAAGYHLREGMCWAITGLFETCSRSSQCYLADLTDRVECRNSLCQCSFDYPYSEELQTCVSSASAIFSNSIVIISALFYLLMKNTFV